MSQKNRSSAWMIALGLTVTLGGIFWFVVWWLSRPQYLAEDYQELFPTPSANAFSNQARTRFAQIQNVPTGEFPYSSSPTWEPLRVTVDAELQAARSEFRLRPVEPTESPPGSSAAIQLLLEGQVAFAQSSRSLTETEYQQAKQRGFTLRQIPVAIDGIAVVVHPRLNLAGLTVPQLQEIYTGQITNWQQLGGDDLSIVPLAGNPQVSGTAKVFLDEVLVDKPLSTKVQTVANTKEGLTKLAQTPGSIYFVSAAAAATQCNFKPLAIRSANKLVTPYEDASMTQCSERRRVNIAAFQNGSYRLTRNLFVILKQNQGIEQQAGEAYANLLLSGQGQEGIAKAGFVRIR
jgi:phosphate transport system substrate-binding protein